MTWNCGDASGGATARQERSEFHVLGPLEVLSDGEPVAIRSGRELALLATLLLRANRLVTLDELIEAVWGEQLPENPRATLHTLIMRLRRRLPNGSQLIHTRPSGYLATAPYLDLEVFRGHVAAADDAALAGDLGREAAELRAGLILWRGPALANVPSETLQRDVVPGLEEERLAALERRIDVDLELGNAGGTVAELRTLTAEHPLRERLWALLIRSLHASGRQAEALDTFATIRSRLINELGVEPNAELRGLHTSMLAGEVSGAAAPAWRVVPRHLPPDVRAFTGRDKELNELDGRLAQQEKGGSTAVVLTAIAGTAGVGKTALAVHWGRKAAHRFPDGQLWVNLRGYDPELPLTADQALTIFLRALGVPGPEIPVELDAQSGLFRSILEDRRVLILLDNANSAEQVRPLLPGAPGCFVLITSRNDLPGLVARDGATRLQLGLLSPDESIELLYRLLGSERATASPEAVRKLVRQCARLPLALRIAADRVSASDHSISEAIAELASDPLLDALAADNDPRVAVRAVFSWSYNALPGPAASMFRRLGLVPGTDWDAYAAAAVAGCSVSEARRALAILTTGHLLEEVNGRYQMHDILRAYAIEQTDIEDTEFDRHASVTRLLDYYLAASAAAMNTTFPHERGRRPRAPDSGLELPELRDPTRAGAWLDTERSNIRAAVTMGVSGWPTQCVRLAATLYRNLYTGAHWVDGFAIHRDALAAAVAAHDRQGEAVTLDHIGMLHWRTGSLDAAEEHCRQALEIFQEVGDRVGEATALNNIGLSYVIRGAYDNAGKYFEQALDIRRASGDHLGEADTMNNLGIVYLRRGHFDDAARHYERVLALRRELGDRIGETDAMNNLSMCYIRLRRYPAAERLSKLAIAKAREIGHRIGEVPALNNLGSLYLGWGRPRLAHDSHAQALALARQMGLRSAELSALNGLGESSQALRLPHEAVGYHETAMQLAAELGESFEQARALDGIGSANLELGQQVAAGRHWRNALTLYERLGVPEAEQVRSKLAALEEQITP